jgi:hypothetical protein
LPGVTTSLQLLMADGAVQVTFRPRLDAEQYMELVRIVEVATTKRDLQLSAQSLAELWGAECTVDDFGV